MSTDAITAAVDGLVKDRLAGAMEPMSSALDSISSSLKAIAERAPVPKEPSESGRKAEAFEKLLDEISVALADVVSALDRGDGSEVLARAIADGLRAVRIEVQAPSVSVNVSPTPVHNHNHVSVPEPVVHVIEGRQGAVFTINFQYGAGGLVHSATVTRQPE